MDEEARKIYHMQTGSCLPGPSCSRAVAGRTPGLPCGWVLPWTELSRVECGQRGLVPMLILAQAPFMSPSLPRELGHQYCPCDLAQPHR